MYVNVDWFFFSHRLPIAESALKNNILMTVFSEFTQHHSSDYSGFTLEDSVLRRKNTSMASLACEFIRVFFQVKNGKPDLVHAVTIKPILFLGVICRLLGVPFIGAISGLGPAFHTNGWRAWLRLKIIVSLYKIIFGGANSFAICQSEHDRDVLVEKHILSKNNVLLVHGSGVDLDKFSPSAKLPSVKPFVLMASRILLDKGVVEFCKASRVLTDGLFKHVDFKLAGSIDELSPSSLSLLEIERLCLDNNVEYLGNVSCVNTLLASAELFVYPSYYPEGIPKVLLEASACGAPIVTTNHPGCRDAIIENQTGVLVEPRDYLALANKIESLLGNPDRSHNMGLRGRVLAEEFYGVEHVVSAHYKLYRNLMNV